MRFGIVSLSQYGQKHKIVFVKSSLEVKNTWSKLAGGLEEVVLQKFELEWGAMSVLLALLG